MHVVLGHTGADAVRLPQGFVLDPSLGLVEAYAALRALAPDIPGDDILGALAGLA